jgi:hypothetical protein
MVNTTVKSTSASVNLNAVAVTTAVEMISARTELKEVEARLKKLEETFKTIGTDVTLGDGTTIKIAQKSRRTVDTAKLKDILSKGVFQRVTKRVGDLKLIDAEIGANRLDSSLVSDAIKATNYESINITIPKS